jgi:glycogen synthase
METSNCDVLFESSWEVCNKVGGIYTVITSKLDQMSKYYKNKTYYCIGPYFPNYSENLNFKGEFEESTCPEEFIQIYEKLKEEGIILHFGNWLNFNNQQVILIDFSNAFYSKDSFKSQLWEKFKIDTIKSSYDYDEPLVWSYAVGRLLEEYANLYSDKKIVAHFHEWMAGITSLYLKIKEIKIATIFTTHATMLGRTLASNQINIYSNLNLIDAPKAAYQYNVNEKYQTECACAKYSDVFTTVSELTSAEATQLLGTKPDILLLNGLDENNFKVLEDNLIEHRLYKNKIKEFTLSYFSPYYDFDIENTLFYYTSGRYEFHDKGTDVLIESLAKLNQKLKEEKSEKNIVFFFLIPADHKNVKQEVIENISFFKDIKDLITDNIHEIQVNLLKNIITKNEIKEESMFKKEILNSIKSKLNKLKRIDKLPPICTHDMNNEEYDNILNFFKKYNLFNKADDKVKVIFYPIYLTGADGLLDTDYIETVLGMNLGLFPSFYEPWGYTPLESSALGVPAITTDASGFGLYCLQNEISKDINPGVFVTKRQNKSWQETIENLYKVMLYYTNLDRSNRINNKINAKKLAQSADWKNLILNYIDAHNLALKRLIQIKN